MAKPISALVGWLDEYDWPKVSCPTCGEGGLDFVEKSITTLEDVESAAKQESYKQGLAGPEELSGTFHGHLICDNSSCRDAVAMAGDWGLWVNDGMYPERGSFGSVYRIRYLNPPLRLMNLPDKTPQKVQDCVQFASSVLWASPASAANQLRQAVEELLTARKVKRFVVNAHGKLKTVPLDARIAIFAKTHPAVAETLMAVKWIGNSGSHDNDLSAEQVLTGAAILEAAVKGLYDKTESELKATVKAINKSKGFPKTKD
ncbi:protein of unknown function [Nocardioides alpinus]|uniref:DUF4145 domain-containing protein n=1 Tax=Nocardioides alpinus TaxID=748909 RepID=A0A1I1A3G3_9ACTN|nr:DUF4145 domain-containing protein [Nocardioides alpinus]PKH42155.1 hypothetical protein CXG46_06675 [Nocardioides alpinus]SFB32052.1 protein of unknown function [Nocardioides alpinus]